MGREWDRWWHGISEHMRVLARNLVEVAEDIWMLLVFFFQQLPAFVKMRRGVCSWENEAFQEMKLPSH